MQLQVWLSLFISCSLHILKRSVFSTFPLNATFFLPTKSPSDDEQLHAHNAVVYCFEPVVSSPALSNISVNHTTSIQDPPPVPANCTPLRVAPSFNNYSGLACIHAGFLDVPVFPTFVLNMFVCDSSSSREQIFGFQLHCRDISHGI